MTRQTSIDAYNQIAAEGLLSKLRFIVYEALVFGGDMTAQECWHYLRGQMAKGGEARINGITPRFSELERQGVIRAAHERKCKITGRICVVWSVTGDLPIPLERPTKIKCEHCGGKGHFLQEKML